MRLGLTAAAVGTQADLQNLGLYTDTHGMPMRKDAAQALDPICLGAAALRHRQREWKAPLALAAHASPLLAAKALRLRDLGGEENALWLHANAGPEAAPLDDIEFLLKIRVRLDLEVLPSGLSFSIAASPSLMVVLAGCVWHLWTSMDSTRSSA